MDKPVTTNPIDMLAMELYERDGFNFGCLPTHEAWEKDREEVRDRYRQLAWNELNGKN